MGGTATSGRAATRTYVQQALYRHPAVRDHHTRTLLPAFSAAPGSSCPWLVCAWCKDVLPSSQHVVVHTCSRVSSKAASSMPCPTGARACRAVQWPQGCIAQRMAVRCSARCMLCPSCAALRTALLAQFYNLGQQRIQQCSTSGLAQLANSMQSRMCC